MKSLASTRQVYITGGMRAGKTTSALYLEDAYNLKPVSIAGKLKELYWNLNKNKKKDREWLQNYGVALRKTFGEDFWVDALIDRVVEDMLYDLTVDDVRYLNELQRLVDYSADLCESQPFNKYLILHVDCPIDIQISRGAEINLMNHKSEDLAKKMHNQIQGNYVYPSYVKLGGEKFVVHAIDGSRGVDNLYEQVDNVMKRVL